MKEVGILDIEIYISVTTFFMIMEMKADFGRKPAMVKLPKMPCQVELALKETTTEGKWRLLERIYKYRAEAALN